MPLRVESQRLGALHRRAAGAPGSPQPGGAPDGPLPLRWRDRGRRRPAGKGHAAAAAASAAAETRFVRGNFALVLRNLAATGVRANAVLLDLGISSMQVDRCHRGFSYATDAPLDMRMDPSSDLSAAEIVNEWDERE